MAWDGEGRALRSRLYQVAVAAAPVPPARDLDLTAVSVEGTATLTPVASGLRAVCGPGGQLRIALPAALAPGEHLLEIEVEAERRARLATLVLPGPAGGLQPLGPAHEIALRPGRQRLVLAGRIAATGGPPGWLGVVNEPATTVTFVIRGLRLHRGRD
jgi:hypothetical protein